MIPIAEKKTPQQQGKASKNKGKVGEREIAKKLREYGFDTRRNQQYNGANGDADVVGVPHIHMEVKRVEKLNIMTAMEQATEEAREGEVPAVFHRRNNKPWLVTMRLEDWVKLYKGELK